MGLFRKKKKIESVDILAQEIDDLEQYVNAIGNTKTAVEDIMSLLIQRREIQAESIWNKLSDDERDGAFWFLIGYTISVMEYTMDLKCQLDELEGDGF